MTAESRVDDPSSDVVELPPAATIDDLEPDTPYVATINGIVEYGVFVDLNDSVSGLVHESNLEGTYAVGEHLVVELDRIRDNGDISFVPRNDLEPPEPTVAEPTGPATADSLGEHLGREVTVEGTVTQIKQTSGPTLFHVSTGDGILVAAAFESAGVRAHPDVELGDVIRIAGEVQRYDGSLQLESQAVTVLEGQQRAEVEEELDERLEKAASPPATDPLVDWEALQSLWPQLEDVATQLRTALLSGRPVRIRHHADVDGICASVPLQMALESFAAAVHHEADAANYLVRRLPSKAPFYEMADATRDLNRSLEDQERHGQQLPLVIMLDNGSTAEDVPAIETLTEYGLSVITIDHHFPDPEAVNEYLEAHVNPYLVDEDYRVTTGMMAVEVARMIDPDVTESVNHLPAVAGTADRSEATAMADYIELASGDEEWITRITEAVDYAAHWLGYRDGRHLIEDILGVDATETERHERVVELFSSRAQEEIDKQLEAATSHLEKQDLDNGATLHMIDLDQYAHRHIYPAPGKTTTALHDHLVEEAGDDPMITIGFGSDFAVLRSDGVRLDIPEIVDDLTESIRGGGVSGGGHLVVGSIRFVGGRREEVLDSLIEHLSSASTDADTGVTGD